MFLQRLEGLCKLPETRNLLLESDLSMKMNVVTFLHIMNHISFFPISQLLTFEAFFSKIKFSVLCSQQEHFSWSQRGGEMYFLLGWFILGTLIVILHSKMNPSWHLIASKCSRCSTDSEKGLIHFSISSKMDTLVEQMCALLCNYFQLLLCPLLSVWNLTLMESEWHLPRDQIQIVWNSHKKRLWHSKSLITFCDWNWLTVISE